MFYYKFQNCVFSLHLIHSKHFRKVLCKTKICISLKTDMILIEVKIKIINFPSNCMWKTFKIKIKQL